MTELKSKYGRKKENLHSQCLSLRAKRTFHAVLLLPVTHTASSEDSAGQWSKEVWGALTSAGFSHKGEDFGNRRTGTAQPGGLLPRERGGGGGHCCLQVESLRILLAVDTPLREGLDEEEDRRSALALLFRDPPSVPFTQTGLARAGLWSACP